MDRLKWSGFQETMNLPAEFDCGHCGRSVNSERGYVGVRGGQVLCKIYICPCDRPTMFTSAGQFPPQRLGQRISHLPTSVESALSEARSALAAGAPTASALMSRKLLQNVACTKGNAEPGKSFAFYIDFLIEHHYVPPVSDEWLHHIREKGNEATHALEAITPADASKVLTFVEHLLRNVFELPNSV